MNFFKIINQNGSENKTISQINFIKDFLVSDPNFLKIKEAGFEDLLTKLVKNCQLLSLAKGLYKRQNQENSLWMGVQGSFEKKGQSKALFSLFGLEKDDFLEVKEEDSFVLVFEKRELLEAHEKVLEKNKKDYWEIFQKMKLFLGWSLERIEKFIFGCQKKKLVKGEYVYRQGENAESLFLIESGNFLMLKNLDLNEKSVFEIEQDFQENKDQREQKLQKEVKICWVKELFGEEDFRLKRIDEKQRETSVQCQSEVGFIFEISRKKAKELFIQPETFAYINVKGEQKKDLILLREQLLLNFSKENFSPLKRKSRCDQKKQSISQEKEKGFLVQNEFTKQMNLKKRILSERNQKKKQISETERNPSPFNYLKQNPFGKYFVREQGKEIRCRIESQMTAEQKSVYLQEMNSIFRKNQIQTNSNSKIKQQTLFSFKIKQILKNQQNPFLSKQTKLQKEYIQPENYSNQNHSNNLNPSNNSNRSHSPYSLQRSLFQDEMENQKEDDFNFITKNKETKQNKEEILLQKLFLDIQKERKNSFAKSEDNNEASTQYASSRNIQHNNKSTTNRDFSSFFTASSDNFSENLNKDKNPRVTVSNFIGNGRINKSRKTLDFFISNIKPQQDENKNLQFSSILDKVKIR